MVRTKDSITSLGTNWKNVKLKMPKKISMQSNTSV